MNVIERIEVNPLMSKGLRLARDIEKTFPNSKAYIVGGCVRDLVMYHEPHDIDIATNANIEAIARHYHSADIGKSRDFGIVLVLFEGEEFEVAHFREEFGSEDNRHPDRVVSVNDFKTDTSRRDITINAMGIDTKGNVIDHQGGLVDIAWGRIRCVGDAAQRFEEDALRILRVARFSARFYYPIEKATELAMKEKSHLIPNLSGERIRDELYKVAADAGNTLREFIDKLDRVHVLDIILPEVSALKNLEHNPEYHPEGDVYDHTCVALCISESHNPLVNLAILFHDLGKAVTQKFEDGQVSYRGHADEGVVIFERIAERLRMSHADRDAISFVIKNHMMMHTIDEMKKSKVVKLRQNPNYELLREVARYDDECRFEASDSEEFKRRMDMVEDIFKTFGEKEEFENRMKVLVNGRMIIDLAEEMSCELSGKDIGMVKEYVRNVIVEMDFDITPSEALFETKRTILRMALVREAAKG